MLKLCKINACPNGTLGIHLSRAPYDPYPWVSGVLENSSAYQSGIRISDTVLECNGTDVLGWKISELAIKIRNHWDCGGKTVSFLIWRNKTEGNVTTPAINQQSLQKFATCLQNIAQLLECPICLEVIKPPGWQCCNGHVLCNSCRNRSVKCPVCRVPFGPRGRCLLSDKLFTLLAETFPCDGSRNGGNKNGRCPQDNHKIKKNNNISKKSTPAAIQQSSSIQQSSQHIQQNIDIRNQPATISLPRPTTISSTLSSTQNQNNNDNETVAPTITITPESITTTRVITVGEETRTSPVKIRNNRNLSNLIIPTTVPISQDEPLVTTTATIIETPTEAIIESDQQHQQQQLSTVSKKIISVPTTTTTTDNRTLLNNTITSTSTVASLHPIIATDTTTTTEQQLNSEKNFIPYMSSTILNPNTNSCDSDVTKNIKQIITLKVKSKSSENLEFLSKKKLNVENIESDKNELQQRPQALSLPASPVSNLVSLKKNHKKIMSTTTTKITSGHEISLEAASQRNNKISSKTLVLNEKSDTKTTAVCPSDSLLSNLMLVYKNYHCPTGKSTCIIEEFDEIFSSSLPSFLTSTKFQHQFHLPTQATIKSTLNTTLFRKTVIKDHKKYLCNESHCCCCCYSCCAQYENKMNPNYKRREVIENIQRDQLNLHLERSSKELCKNLNIKTDINNNCCNSKKLCSCNNVIDVMNDDFSQNGKTNDKNDDDEIIKTITSTSASKSYQKTNLDENHHHCFNLNDVEKVDDIKVEDIKLQVHMKLFNHIRRNHKIPLCQYHCGLNEKIPIDNNMMMKKNNKSNILMCISIDDNETEENSIAPIESHSNFISLPCTTALLKTPEEDDKNYISSFGNSYSNCSTYINQSSFSSIPSTVIPVISHNNEDDRNKIIQRQSEITESSLLLSSSTSSLSNIIMNNSNKIKENPIQIMETSSKTIESKEKNSTSSTVNILKEIKNSLTRLDSQQMPPQTNKILSENINKLQKSIKNSTENSNGIFHLNNCSIITSTSSNNHQQHHHHYQYPQPYRQVYKKRSFESCSDLNSKKLISELNSKNFIEDASRTKLSTTATIKTTTTDKTSSQLPIHYNKKILKSFPTTTCTAGTATAAVSCCKSYFATKLNTNQKIPNSNEYKISIECIEKIRFKTELFFIIKIPLKNYKEMNFCNKCNTINNNNNNKNCKNIERNFLSKKYSNGMDSGEQINILDKENQICSSMDNNKTGNSNNKNDINNIGLQQLKTERQHPKDVHVLQNFKINQSNNLINSEILEQPPASSSIDSNFCHNQHHYHHVYNSHHHNSVQQLHHLECNQNNIIDKKNFTAIEKRAAHLKGGAIESLDNENNILCCNNCKSPTKISYNCKSPTKTSILNSYITNSNTTNSPQSLNDVTYCCKCNCNSSNNCNINTSNKKCCNNVEYKNLRKKSAIFIWYCGSDYELNVKNFRAVIECCNIIKERDNDSNDIMNINTNIINKNNINNVNDDDDYKVIDNDDKKNQKLFWNSNNKINIVTNKNLNNANKCIHEQNIKDVKSSTINSSKHFSTLSSKSILPILPISSSTTSSSSSSTSSYNMNNKKISLWIHPMTKSWNCIRDHMEFHLLDDDTNYDLNDSNDEK